MPPFAVTEKSCTEAARSPRIICYYQTHFHNREHVSILPLLERRTAVTHIIVAAIHLNEGGVLTLNNEPFDSPRTEVVWEEVRLFQKAGVKVLGMLGGAAKGSFRRLEEDFDLHYAPLRNMILQVGLDGLDLDVEEKISLGAAIHLINQLHEDFGNGFLVTLAPVATALQGKRHLSGFDYAVLEEVFGRHIAWYNTQFYCGWGDAKDTTGYDKIIKRGWPPDKVVLGLSTSYQNARGWVPDDLLANCLHSLAKRYPDFGGVMGWEYFRSMTIHEPWRAPWSWAAFMTRLLLPGFSSSKVADDRIQPLKP